MDNSAELLREALAALKEAGVQRAALKLADLELSVEFPIELPVLPPAGDAPRPGGWKGPQAIDMPFEDDK